MSLNTKYLSIFSKKNETRDNGKKISKNITVVEPDIVELIPKIVNSKFNKGIIITGDDEDELEESEESEESEELAVDKFDNYIIQDSVQNYTSNAQFLRFCWNGIGLLDKWELQRKVDIDHVNELAKSMYSDYKKNKEFTSYDPVHLGKKKGDDKFYVLDGQHRLEAYNYFYKLNKFPIQQIPTIVWYTKNEADFIELFHKINSRLSIDKLKLVQIKLLEIFEGLENKYEKNIWGSNRPKINKELFTDKLRNTESIHKLTTGEILIKLYKINENIRGLPRNSRVKPNCASSIHTSAENIDFFLGLDKNMSWINEI
jgi:hypothetical protein